MKLPPDNTRLKFFLLHLHACCSNMALARWSSVATKHGRSSTVSIRTEYFPLRITPWSDLFSTTATRRLLLVGNPKTWEPSRTQISVKIANAKSFWAYVALSRKLFRKRRARRMLPCADTWSHSRVMSLLYRLARLGRRRVIANFPLSGRGEGEKATVPKVQYLYPPTD